MYKTTSEYSLTLHESEFISIQIPEVYTLPQVLSDIQIGELLKLKELKCHHDEEGHVIEYPDEEKPKKDKPQKKKSESDDKDKKRTNYFRADKPHKLPWIASLIWRHIPSDIRIDDLRPCGVDENMQLYKLQGGASAVSQHMDEDFYGQNQSIALFSILIYLNNGYTGGETIFNRIILAPRVGVGSGLLFRHNILHEGLTVQSGEKYVLKTDLFFRRE